jgi:hypothetical protein
MPYPKNSPSVTLTTPVTWVPTGSMTAVTDQAIFSLSIAGYGNNNQIPQAIPGAIDLAAQNGGAGSALTLAGHPSAIWWDLVAPAQPGCAAGCGGGVPPSPEILTIGALIQFTMVDGGVWSNGIEVDLSGSARANAQPVQVFCDMEAMILGVTLAH